MSLAPPKDPRPAVLSIGKFDGVHRGHQRILETALGIKKEAELFSVISFSPHPLWALKKMPEYREAITPGTEKERWLAHYGVDVLFETDFTAEYAETTPELFVYEHLSKLNLSHIIVGEEFNFGKGRASDVKLLRSLCRSFEIEVTAVPVKRDGEDGKISSTDIRALIRRAEFLEAEQLLGHPRYITGTVDAGLMTGLSDYVLPEPGMYQAETGMVEVTKDHALRTNLPQGEHSIRLIEKI